MSKDKLTRLGKLRKFLIDNLTDEDCMQIIENAGIELKFKRLIIDVYLIRMSEFNRVMELNNVQSLYNKAKITNVIEFKDKFYVLHIEGRKTPVLTPKGAILYALCTQGNQYVRSLEKEVFKYIYRAEEKGTDKSKRDTLSYVFKGVNQLAN